MLHQRPRRHAPLARLVALSLCVGGLALLAEGVRAAPARQVAETPTTTSAPTEPPSATGTSAPTVTPSATATTAPTATPSATGTSAPTATPSATATTAPTATPSATGTTAPTATATPLAAPALAPGAAVIAPAQAVSLDISKTLVGSDVVQVGQYLTFTIQITNTGAVTVTKLPLVDEYQTTILEPAATGTVPPPTSSAPGVLRWANLADTFGDLAPGRSITVTAIFRALRIDNEVINRARIETSLGSGGSGGAPIEDAAGGTIKGGQVIVEKALIESFLNLDTPVISFTLSLRNAGFTDIVEAPLVDTYRADVLRFISASVPPDAHNPATGELRWNNLLANLGVARLKPQETVSFTTVYSVTGAINDAVANSADVVAVKDEFGNQVASPRRAEVRIRVSGPGAEATATPTATPTDTPAVERGPRDTPTPVATVAATVEVVPTAAAATVEVGTSTAVAGTPLAASAPSVAATPAAAPTGTAVAPAGGGGASTAPTTLPATGAAETPSAPWPLALLAIAAGLALHGVNRRRTR